MNTIVLCIIPEEPHFSEILATMKHFSHELGSKDALRLPPHFTVVGRFKTEKYETFLEALQKECQRTPPFQLTIDKIDHFQDPKIIFFHIKKTPELQHLHEKMLELTTHYREPWSRDSLKNAAVNDQQKALVEKYGSPYVKQFYSPHITIAGPDVDQDKFEMLTAAALPCKPFTIAVNHISILKKIESGWIIDRKIELGK
jgi:2'-5' RNA ligase